MSIPDGTFYTDPNLRPGDVAAYHPATYIFSRVAEGAIKFGRGLMLGTNTSDQAKVFSSASGKFIGVAKASTRTANIANSAYADKDMVGVMDNGFAVVYVEEAVGPEDPVRVRHTPGATSGYQAWGFSSGKAGTDSTGLAADTSATSGYQSVDLGTSKAGGDATGLANDSTTFGMIATVDGVAKEIVVTGSAVQTYTLLLAAINTDLGGSATASLSSGDLRITSNSSGAASTVRITNANAGASSSLLAGLYASFAIATAVDGVAAGAVTYGAIVTVDGTPQEVLVNGSAAQTFADLIEELNDDLTGATAAIVSGKIRITSDSTGAASTIKITDGNDSAANDLCAELTDANVSPDSAVAGAATGAEAGQFRTTAIAGSTVLLEGAQFAGVTTGAGPVPLRLTGSFKTTADV